MRWVSNAMLRRFTLVIDLVPSVQKAGWDSRPVWTGAENLAPPEFDPRTVYPVASRCTDHASSYILINLITKLWRKLMSLCWQQCLFVYLTFCALDLDSLHSCVYIPSAVLSSRKHCWMNATVSAVFSPGAVEMVMQHSVLRLWRLLDH